MLENGTDQISVSGLDPIIVHFVVASPQPVEMQTQVIAVIIPSWHRLFYRFNGKRCRRMYFRFFEARFQQRGILGKHIQGQNSVWKRIQFSMADIFSSALSRYCRLVVPYGCGSRQKRREESVNAHVFQVGWTWQ